MTLTRNPFDAGGYSLADMTQAINILPNLYTRLGQIGLFRFEGVSQRSIVIEQREGVLSLLPSVPLGAPATVGTREQRSMRSFALPWIPHDDVILPADIQGMPALGLSDTADPLVEVMNRKLTLMRRKHAQTREYMEMNALRGIVKDGAGTTLYDYFTEFGLEKISIDFVFGTAGTNVQGKVRSVLRAMEDNLLGETMTTAHALVSSEFFDKLISHPKTEEAYKFFSAIPESTLVGWCGRAMKTLSPLIEQIEVDIMGCDLLHADDTPIRVLDRSLRDKGLGKGVRQGRIWAYVRDQRPWAGAAPPGAVYRFAPNWKEEHVLSHLADARGILQADGYKGYAKLYQPEADGVPSFREAACWAHLRRDFHDFWASTKSEIAREALDRIGKLYDIERDINGQTADVRHAARQKLSQPKVTAFFAWSEQQLLRIPGKSDLAKAFRYGLNRQEAFSLFLTDGRVAIDNNPAERALRPIANGWSLYTSFLSACKH